ncbi:hypothetical protein [Streptomyces sp. NPDC001933]|uniref:hypothetical protein n=1 Tax=Streptomyces sp. NPDC001933 TaxID=3364626 RepID=UPI0036A9A5F9
MPPSKTAVPGSPAPGSGSGPAAVATPATAPDLVSEKDLIGSKATPSYATTLAHDGKDKLHTITDPRGRVYTLTWASSHITSLTDSAGRKVTYGYDSDNNLTDVYGVGPRSPSLEDDDHYQYTYDASHLMKTMRKPVRYGSNASPTPVTSMTYDTSGFLQVGCGCCMFRAG